MNIQISFIVLNFRKKMAQLWNLAQSFAKQTDNISPKYWLKHIEHIIAIYMFFKSSLYLALEYYYIKLLSKFPSGEHGRWDEAHKQSVLEYQIFLRQCGLATRDLRTATIFGYSVFFSILATFSFVNLFTRNRVAEVYKTNNIIQSYINPAIAEANLIRQFDIHINKVIDSNRQTVRFILHHLSRSSSGQSRTDAKLVGRLNSQRDHLNQLLVDKSTIWPTNFGTEWRRKQKDVAVYLYYIIGLALMFGSILAAILAHSLTYQMFEAKNELPMNKLERIALAELLMCVMSTGDPFISAIVVLIMNFYDRVVQLRSISGHLLALNSSLRELKLQRQAPSMQPRANKPAKFELDKQHGEYLNKEALEVYLGFRVFAAELKPVIRMANMIMNQCLVFILIVFAITLFCYEDVDSTQANILMVMTLNFIAVINFALGMGAAFEATCKKTAQLIWSFLAHSSHRDITNLSSGRHSNKLRAPQIKQPIAREVSTTTTTAVPSRADDDSIINPHTVFLWRQLVREQQCTYGRSNCMILNMIQLNYQSLLRMNFWFISAVLIYLTENAA